MRNIRLVLEYDGTDYCGFQDQARPDRPTVQAKLEEALAKTVGERVRITAAGRTDAGVHALGQVVNFVSDTTIPIERIPVALNTRLPKDIAVIRADVVPIDFHARYWAKAKTYRYTWYTRPVLSPFYHRYVQHVPRPLDVPAMHRAAALFVGEHDFAAFRSAHGSTKTTVRHIYASTIERTGDLVHFTIEGSGFLYNMVRIMAGTLLEIGLGRRDIDSVKEALRLGDRELAGPTAPPHGLTLVSVAYDEV